jgi:hypothetical protein
MVAKERQCSLYFSLDWMLWKVKICIEKKNNNKIKTSSVKSDWLLWIPLATILVNWLLWKVNCCYGQSMVFMEVNGC